MEIARLTEGMLSDKRKNLLKDSNLGRDQPGWDYWLSYDNKVDRLSYENYCLFTETSR